MAAIRFKFSAPKAFAAITWMVRQQGRIDLHSLLKACYFADKRHLNEHGRPVFGARYRAMPWGPVPLEIYEMAKGEAIWLAELEMETLPWTLDGYHLVWQQGANGPDLDQLSRTDREALEWGLRHSLSMDFGARTAATHGPDWQAANLGMMKYEDMVEDSPRKAEVVAYLREAAKVMKL